MTAFAAETTRDVAVVEGPDAATYLQSQLSQDLTGLADGETTWTMLLEPSGKVDVLARLTRRGAQSFVLDTEAGFGETMHERLGRFKIRVKADVTAHTWPAVAVRDLDQRQSLDDVVDALVLPAWPTARGRHLDVIGAGASAVAERFPAGDSHQLTAARLEASWPAMGTEIVPGETIPGGLAAVGVITAAVSFSKGCYPGQELVERMDSRAVTAPRVLTVVDVPVGAAAGDVYRVDGTDGAFTLTSAAGGRAFVWLPRSAV